MAQVHYGHSDEEILLWLKKNGTPKSDAEVKAWSDEMEAALPYNNPDKKAWFAGECKKLGLDPAKTTMYGWLDYDDKVSFKK